MNPSPDIRWKIGAQPATLTQDEFWSDEQRLHVLAMLLEAVGVKKALSLCSPEAVRAAPDLRSES